MNAFQKFLAVHPGGFITDADVAELIAVDRLCPCLVRCGGVRFTCGAQYLKTMIGMVEQGGDYVRDVSVTAQAMELAAQWVPEPSPVPVVKPSPATSGRSVPRSTRHDTLWDESQCGGVFDGFQVTSDADSGL
jgi:hypothetical protein